MIGLTPRQSECLTFIKAYIDVDAVAPSLDEICVAMGLKSKSGAKRLLEGLEERGVIRRSPGRARSIEIIDPATMQAVSLNSEIFNLVRAYAASERIGIDTAANALLRDCLGAS
jgi:SOS-response transcriptional repressor LexA